MDTARRHFLACPCRPAQQYARTRRRHFLNGAAQLLNTGRPAKQFRLWPRAQPEVANLSPEPRRFQGPRQHQQQPIRFEGLFDEIISALLDRLHRGFNRAMT